MNKNIWEFLDALGDRAPGKALQTVAQLLDQGDAPLQILAMVSRFYRQLTIGHTVLHRGGSKSEAAKEAGVPHFKEATFSRQCRRYTHEDLSHARATIYSLDQKLKSSKVEGRVWLEHGILEMSAPRGWCRTLPLRELVNRLNESSDCTRRLVSVNYALASSLRQKSNGG